MRDAAAVLAVRDPLLEVPGRLVALICVKRDGVGVAQLVEHVGELGVLGRAAGVDDVPERRRVFGGGAFGSKAERSSSAR